MGEESAISVETVDAQSEQTAHTGRTEPGTDRFVVTSHLSGDGAAVGVWYWANEWGHGPSDSFRMFWFPPAARSRVLP